MQRWGWHKPVAEVSVIGLAALIAFLSARPYAGAWNDGSRLATVECLVDYHTLAIDHSVFVEIPRQPDGPSPYAKDQPGPLEHGTGDKLLIHGHYYSDKSPVPAVLLAGVYQVAQWLTGLRAREHPNCFCYWMNLFSAGVSYVLAVWCVLRLCVMVQIRLALGLLVTASFACSTVTLAYERHVNNHIMLLAVVALLLVGLVRLAKEAGAGRATLVRLVAIGTLAGLGYSLDLGAGPVLLACTITLVAFRCRRASAVLVCVLAAWPWLALHHVINYLVGGTFKPANAVAEYLQWPGSSFGPENMTGTWKHHSVPEFLLYALGLLFGKRGFVGHNLPLFLALPAVVILARRRVAELPEIMWAVLFCGGTWLAYALTSNNSSGACCSVRWFVPFLAPGYYILVLLLRQQASYTRAFLILSGWGAVLGALMWRGGPWMLHMVPWFWQVQGAALLSLFALWYWHRRRQPGPALPEADHLMTDARAA